MKIWGDIIKKEQVIEIANNVGLKPINDLPDWIKTKDHFGYIDEKGYKYFLTVDELKDERSKHAIVKNYNPYSLDNIKTFIKINNGKCKVVSKKWTHNKDKIKISCEKCGKIYSVKWYYLYSNCKFTCNQCSKNNPPNKKSIYETEKICRKHGYHIIDGTYKSRKQFDMIDKIGYKYSNCSIYTLNNRNNKIKRFEYRNKYQIDNMKLYIIKNNINMRIKEGQNNIKNNEYLQAYCSECGSIFNLHWYSVYKDSFSCRCSRCTKKKSNLEYIVEQYLIKKNIKYSYQKTFEWCKIKRKLPFDFYLEDYNAVIEVNGSQHYYSSTMFNQSLEKRIDVDNFKKECCISHGIEYIAIPFWLITQSKIDTYKKIIDNITK